MISFKIDGKHRSLMGKHTVRTDLSPLGMPRWDMITAVWEDDLLLVGWVDRQFSDVAVKMTLVNTSQDWAATPRELVLGHFRYPLAPQSGLGWTNQSWVRWAFPEYAGDGVGKVFDLRRIGDSLGLGGDLSPNSTKDTGSGGVSLHHAKIVPARRLAQEKGLKAHSLCSRDLFRVMDQERLEDLQRPRNWFPLNGAMPGGFQARATMKVNDLGEITSPVLPGFNEWFFSYHGGHDVNDNAYDLQHLDESNSYEGWKLTGDPSFLYRLVGVWCHARCNVQRLQRVKDRRMGGSWRAFGYWMRLCAQLYDAISPLGTPWDWLRNDLLEEITWWLGEHSRTTNGGRDPWLLHEGSAPEEFIRDGYWQPWQRAVEARGLQYVRDLVIHPLLGDKEAEYWWETEYAARASDATVDEILRTYLRPSRTIPYLVSRHGDEQRGPLTGTGLWPLAAALNSSYSSHPYVEDALEAASKLRDRYPRFHMSLVGGHESGSPDHLEGHA